MQYDNGRAQTQIAPQALLIYSFFSCRAEQNSMIFLSSCTVKALPFFDEYRSETILRIGFKSVGKSSAAVAKIAESKVFNLCAVRCFPASENENK